MTTSAPVQGFNARLCSMLGLDAAKVVRLEIRADDTATTEVDVRMELEGGPVDVSLTYVPETNGK
jgi:hypothetical protein